MMIWKRRENTRVVSVSVEAQTVTERSIGEPPLVFGVARPPEGNLTVVERAKRGQDEERCNDGSNSKTVSLREREIEGNKRGKRGEKERLELVNSRQNAQASAQNCPSNPISTSIHIFFFSFFPLSIFFNISEYSDSQSRIYFKKYISTMNFH